MARTAGSWALLAALALAAIVQPMGCGPEQGANPGAESVRRLLDETPAQVIVPTYEQVRSSLELLRVPVQRWSETGDVDAKAEAQEAWRAAMSSWQVAELLQVGPAAPGSATGGADLRDTIYSWPTVNPCRVDQETVLAQWLALGV